MCKWWAARAAGGGKRVRPCPAMVRRPTRLPRTGVDDIISIPLGSATDLSVRWQPRREETRGSELVSVEQSLFVGILDSGMHLSSDLHYRVQQGAVSEVRLSIPPGITVQSVLGQEVADWSIEVRCGRRFRSRRTAARHSVEDGIDNRHGPDGSRLPPPWPTREHGCRGLRAARRRARNGTHCPRLLQSVSRACPSRRTAGSDQPYRY